MGTPSGANINDAVCLENFLCWMVAIFLIYLILENMVTYVDYCGEKPSYIFE